MMLNLTKQEVELTVCAMRQAIDAYGLAQGQDDVDNIKALRNVIGKLERTLARNSTLREVAP